MNNNYEKTILNLLERVAVIEDEMKILKENQIKIDSEEVLSEKKDKSKIHATFNKNGLINELKNKVASLGIEITKASLAEGGGVITKYRDNESKKAMLRRSKNYVEKGFDWRGWHTIKSSDIKSFDSFIFSIENEGKLHFFIFSKQEFKKVLALKTTDSNDIYHFYLNKSTNNEGVSLVTDDREDSVIDMKEYYQNWNALKK